MKIGFFTSIEGWGGSEIQLLTLMEGLRNVGHNPVLYGIGGTRLCEECRARGIQQVAWKTVPRPFQINCGTESLADRGNSKSLRRRLRGLIPVSARLLFGNAKEVWRLVRLFRQNPCDVMHVSVNGYELAGLACWIVGIPSLAWHCIMPERDPLPIRRWLIRWTNRCYSKMGGVSKTCIDAWRQWCRFESSQCCWVWNGIDVSHFLAEEVSGRFERKPFIMLAVGRLHPMKGFNLLIRAFASLKDEDVVLRIAGEGNQEKELRGLVGDLGLGNRVEFLGHQEDVRCLYVEASCFVLPSVSHESFGLVLAEAMASGLPVITSDFGPLPEINIHGETGLVVPSGDPSALAMAIRQLMDDVALAKRMGMAGRKRALQCFTRDRMVGEMIVLYDGLVRG